MLLEAVSLETICCSSDESIIGQKDQFILCNFSSKKINLESLESYTARKTSQLKCITYKLMIRLM